jgi:flagellin
MSLRINTNTQAIIALENLDANQTNLQGSIQRLSSGLRVSNAADDPAGLIISQNMGSRIQGVGAAIQNSQNAINLAKTADGALQEVSNLLQTMRTLAVQSANSAVLDRASLQANQTQINAILQSIDRIAKQTEFGSKKLLDGTAGTTASITDTTDVNNIFLGTIFGTSQLLSGPVTVNVSNPATAGSLVLGNTFSFATSAVGTAGSFVINGFTFSTDGTDSLQGLVGKINTQSQTTGVTAQIAGSSPNLSVQLTQSNYGSQFGINLIDPNKVLDSVTTNSALGTDAVATVSANTSTGVQSVLFTGGRAVGDTGLKLTDTNGNAVTISAAGNANLSSATAVGVVTSGSVLFQIGPEANQAQPFSLPDVNSNKLGTNPFPGLNLASVDVTSQSGATQAIQIIDDAISQIGTMRGQIGAFQSNILESNVRSLQVAQQNLSASQSQIQDVDVAQEITNFTRFQILNQSGISVLAQANQQPQSVLQLLK